VDDMRSSVDLNIASSLWLSSRFAKLAQESTSKKCKATLVNVSSLLAVESFPAMDICCWMTRDLQVVQKISLLEIVSTAVLLANAVVVVVDLLESSMLLTQATLQATHRCTPAPCGTLAAPAALPTHSFGDVDPCLDSDLRTLC